MRAGTVPWEKGIWASVAREQTPMASLIRPPNGVHGVIIVHPFGMYREADFIDDPKVIDRLIASGEGWRITDAVRLDRTQARPGFHPGPAQG